MVDVGEDRIDQETAEVPDAELFLDERGSLLRARRVAGAVELSVWRDGRCVATHRLPAADADRLAALLAACAGAALVPTVGDA